MVKEDKKGIGEVNNDRYKREIKFRAWDKYGVFINNKTGEAEPHMIDNVGFSIKPDWFMDDGKLRISSNQDDFILMQFTGLIDRDGQDIYEGDIILQNGPNSARRVIRYYHGNPIAIRGDGVILLSYIVKTVKVIGNIYENPEALGEYRLIS